MNAPPLYNATHNYTNNLRNSSRLKIAGVKAALGVCIMMNMKEQGLGTCIQQCYSVLLILNGVNNDI